MTASADSPRSFLFSRPALLFFSSDLCSSFGRYVLFLALAVWVQQTTGSASLAGVTAAFVLVGSLTSPVTGALVDRLERRRALITPLVVTAALLAVLLCEGHRPLLPLLYTVGFFYGAIGSMADAAQSAVVAAIFEDSQRMQANSLHQTLGRGLRSVGPLVGVSLYALVGIHGTIALAVASYAASALLVSTIPLAADPAPREAAPLFSVRAVAGDVRRGTLVIWNVAALRIIVFTSASALFFLNFFETVGLKVVTQGLHQPATQLATLISVQGVATIASGILLTRYGKRYAAHRLMLTGLLCFMASALLQTTDSLWLVFAAMAVAGAGLPMCIVAMVTTVQKEAPRESLGTVFGATQFLVGVPQAVGAAAGSGLVSLFDFRYVCLIIAGGLLLTCADLVFATGRARKEEVGEDVDDTAAVGVG